MALPYTFSGINWSQFKNSDHGPWEYGGNLYSLWVDIPNLTVEVWKSTDDGDSWAEVDAANHPAIFDHLDDLNMSTSGHFTGTDIIVGLSNTSNTSAGFVVFQCDTDTWDATVNTNLRSAYNSGFGFSGFHAYAALKRADNAVVVVGQGDTNGVMGQQYRAVRTRITSTDITTSTWVIAQTLVFGSVQIHYDFIGACVDASGRVYVFAHNSTNSRLECAVILPNNTVSSPIIVDSTVIASGNYAAGMPRVVDSTTDRVVIAYVNSDGVLHRASANVADTPSFTSTSFSSSPNPEYTNSNPASIALDGTTEHWVWPDDVDQDLYWKTGIASPTELLDAVTIQGISAGYISSVGSGGVGYLYNDGGSVKYNGPAGAIIESLTAALSAEGTLTASSDATRGYLAALSAEGTLSASILALATRLLAASLSGTGTAAAETDILRSILPDALSGEGQLLSDVIVSIPIAAALDGTGTLSADALLTRGLISTLDGNGTLSSLLGLLYELSGTLSATGTLSGQLDPTLGLTSSLDAIGTLTGETDITRPVQAGLSGTGSLATALDLTAILAAALDATGTLTTNLDRGRDFDAALSAEGTLAADPVLTRSLLSAMSGTGTLSLDQFFDAFLLFSADLDASGTLAAAASLQAVFAASLDATGTLATTTSRDRGMASALSATGTLSSDADILKTYLGTLDATGTLAAELFTGGFIELLSALSAEGTAEAQVEALFSLSSSLDADGTISADTVLVRGLTGALDAQSDLLASMDAARTFVSSLSAEGILALLAFGPTQVIGSLLRTSPDDLLTLIRTSPTDSLEVSQVMTLIRTSPSDSLLMTLDATALAPIALAIVAPDDPFTDLLTITESADPFSLARTLLDDPLNLSRAEGDDIS
jgi:hypothetical protein